MTEQEKKLKAFKDWGLNCRLVGCDDKMATVILYGYDSMSQRSLSFDRYTPSEREAFWEGFHGPAERQNVVLIEGIE